MPRKKEETMDIMNIDILNPGFIELFAEVKEISEAKEQKTDEFKKLYMKHKAEMAEYDHKVAEIKQKMAALAVVEQPEE